MPKSPLHLIGFFVFIVVTLFVCATTFLIFRHYLDQSLVMDLFCSTVIAIVVGFVSGCLAHEKWVEYNKG